MFGALEQVSIKNSTFNWWHSNVHSSKYGKRLTITKKKQATTSTTNSSHKLFTVHFLLVFLLAL